MFLYFNILFLVITSLLCKSQESIDSFGSGECGGIFF